MCEEDYEVDESGQEIIHQHNLSIDDFAVGKQTDEVNSLPKKKPKREKNHINENGVRFESVLSKADT